MAEDRCGVPAKIKATGKEDNEGVLRNLVVDANVPIIPSHVPRTTFQFSKAMLKGDPEWRHY